MNKELFDFTFSSFDAKDADENIEPREIEDFESSRIGRWLIANMILVQRTAAMEVISTARLNDQGEVVKLDENIVDQSRGVYLAIDNILTMLQIIKEGESHA